MMAPSWDVVAATAHRPQHYTPAETVWVQRELPRVTVKLRDRYGMTTGVSGMAVGGDMWWAAELVEAGVDLWAHVPFPQQPDLWTRATRAEWRRLVDLAREVTVYGDHYDPDLFHARNDGMLAVAQAVLAIWKPSKRGGGTVSAVGKAMKRGLPIVHMNPEDRTVRLLNSNSAVSAGPPTLLPESTR